MPSYSFSEPCSGRDCYFCGPLDEVRRLSPEAEARQQRENDLQMAHDFGMHEGPDPEESYLAGFQADCPGCQTLRGLGLV